MPMQPRIWCAVALPVGIASAALAQQPTFDLTNITWLKAQGLDGSGVVLGQIEPGIAVAHTSFGNRVALTEPGVLTQGFIPAGSPAYFGPNNVNHATHVAGIMISAPDTYNRRTSTGVCPGAQLVNTNVDSSAAEGGNFYSGLDWLSRPTLPADVINCSWGFTSPTPAARRAVDWVASQRGKLVVVACDNTSRYGGPGGLNSPEDGYNVLSVGATGWRSQSLPISENNVNYNRIAWYSGVGPAANGNRKPDIVAPGTAIYSASGFDLNAGGLFNDYSTRDGAFGFLPPGREGEVNGCSFAAPHVAGVAGLLVQYATGKSWEADGKAPTTLRAAFINGASKTVSSRSNRRWESGFGNITLVGNTNPAPLDPQLGAGLLDARRTFEIFRGGNISPDVRRGGPNGPEYISGAPPRPNVGWSRNSVYGTGANGNGQTDLQPAGSVRKGTYTTATLAWEMDMTGATPGSAADAVGGLKNLDLNIFRDGSPTLVAGSTSTDGSVEHVVFKTPEREKYTLNVQSFADTPTNYTLAWHTYEAPTSTGDFNGDFFGDRGSLNDNGWYETSSTGNSIVGVPAFINQPSDVSWAMTLDPSLNTPMSVAQEAFNPVGGFFLQFDIAFDPGFVGGLGVTLGSLDLLALGGVSSGLIFPISGTNISQYQTCTLFYDAAAIAGLSGQFSDLSFLATGSGGKAFIDNIRYVPTPGAAATLALAGLFGARRRRR